MSKLRFVLLIFVLLISFVGVSHSQTDEWERHSVDEKMDVYSTEEVMLWLPQVGVENSQGFVDSVFENYGKRLDKAQIENSFLGDLLSRPTLLGLYYIFDDPYLPVNATLEYYIIDTSETELAITIDSKKNRETFFKDLSEGTGINFKSLSTQMGIVGHAMVTSADETGTAVFILVPTIIDSKQIEYYILIGYIRSDMWNNIEVRESILLAFTSLTYHNSEYSEVLYLSLIDQAEQQD